MPKGFAMTAHKPVKGNQGGGGGFISRNNLNMATMLCERHPL